MGERTIEEIDSAAVEKAFSDAFQKLESVVEILDVIERYVTIEFERTSAGKPIMLVRSKTIGQSWFIHITEEEFEKSVKIEKILEKSQAEKESA